MNSSENTTLTEIISL